MALRVSSPCPLEPVSVDGNPMFASLCAIAGTASGSRAPGGRPAALQLFAHAAGNVAKLPVSNVLYGLHFVADVTFGIGEVVHDYLAQSRKAPVQNPSLAATPPQWDGRSFRAERHTMPIFR